ncbi:MAG TPA: fibronectin type III domain-containing protein, partial [Chloroflexota bacterium]|nr:fibronectin type III domain-containing protein [Chloroflexota bacterium]
MDGKRTTWFAAVALAGLSLLFCPQASFGWFTVPPPAGVQVVLNTQDAQLSSYASPGNQSEWLLNSGGGSSMRIKGAENPSLVKFDLSAYKGQQVVAAELHLARPSWDYDNVSALVASTVNTDWSESTVCYRYRALPSTEWAYPHSDATCATFGNFGTLVSFGCSANGNFKTYSYNGNTWIALVNDPSLIQAMILDQPGGLAITDSRYHNGGNPTVYTKDQNSSVQPRLFIQFAPSTDTTPPAAVGSLAAAPGMDNGTVELSFTAPSDPDDAKAFGYTVRYSTASDFSAATDVARWRIPRPKTPAAPQKMLIEGLTPGTSYYFFVQAYDAVGNAGTVASVQYVLPAAVTTPVLANGNLATPVATGKAVQTVAGIMRYFAASETAKINPATGNRYEDGYTGTGADDYKKANVVWDSATNTISLSGCRNEMVGSQLIL